MASPLLSDNDNYKWADMPQAAGNAFDFSVT